MFKNNIYRTVYILIYIENVNIEDWKNSMEKLQKIKLNQFIATKICYEFFFKKKQKRKSWSIKNSTKNQIF